MLFRTAAERHGAEVLEASNGVECIETASASAPDVIILDVVMPNRDGFSTLPTLRQLFPDTPVILTSANATDELIAHGRAWGASDCIDKLQLLPLIPRFLDDVANTRRSAEGRRPRG